MEHSVHSFLMIGQSNMAGRGYLKDVKPIYNDKIKMLVNGRWQTMTEPINPDRPTSGAGLATSFAGAWCLNNEEKTIGLIPCADGGSSLDEWTIGGALFENAVFQARLAQRISSLNGILWHQGENDSFAGWSSYYYNKLAAIVDALRKDLKVPVIPFIAGELGDFLGGGRYGKYFTEYSAVNQALQKFAYNNPNTYFVTSSGLTANADGLHFDAASLRKFGIRYFEAYNRRKNILSPVTSEDEIVNIIQDRPLTKSEKAALLEISFATGGLSLAELEMQLLKLSAQ
ncbi:MAG: sialate O-acetylesterase [Sphingobacteriaceae bacterium]|nr:MAG: sialate O-acetylesterase [Sphingobacteriaceae bacterium]